jgi:hypothetical protein
MKIERERDHDYERWCFEVDGWVDRGLVAVLAVAISGGGAWALHLPQSIGLLA